jgi:hypothetical protein
MYVCDANESIYAKQIMGPTAYRYWYRVPDGTDTDANPEFRIDAHGVQRARREKRASEREQRALGIETAPDDVVRVTDSLFRRALLPTRRPRFSVSFVGNRAVYYSSSDNNEQRRSAAACVISIECYY